MASAFRFRRGEASVSGRIRSIRLIAACLSLAATGYVTRAQACSQCMCGTPFPAGVLGGAVPMQLTTGIEDRYLSKTSGLDQGPGEELELEHRVAAFAMWRPLNRLALLGRLPYNIKQVTEHPGRQSRAPRRRADWATPSSLRWWELRAESLDA